MYPLSRHMTLNICLVMYVIVRIKLAEAYKGTSAAA